MSPPPVWPSAAPCRMLSTRRAFLLLLAITITSCAEDEQGETLTEDTSTTSVQSIIAFDFLYHEGVNMYLQDNWEECVRNIELALQGWHYWNDHTAWYEHCAVLCIIMAGNLGTIR